VNRARVRWIRSGRRSRRRRRLHRILTRFWRLRGSAAAGDTATVANRSRHERLTDHTMHGKDSEAIDCNERSDTLKISRWVNEPLPPWPELLTAHDLARLTRRPRWWLRSMSFIGRFPKRRRIRGKALCWFRTDVLDWLSCDRSFASGKSSLMTDMRIGSVRSGSQRRFPSQCSARVTNGRLCQAQQTTGARPPKADFRRAEAS
jgi:hypothetical protein